MPAKWKTSRLFAVIALVVVTAVWGSTFIVVKDAVARFPVMDFLWLRFALAALLMFILRPVCLRGFSRRGVLRGMILGIFLGSGYIAQTFGLLWASATVSGFITGMFVVFTPFVSWAVLREKPNRYTWVAVILATVGLGFLGLRGWSLGAGELLTLLCALAFAIHIAGLGKWSSLHDSYGLTFIQITTVAIISLLSAVPQGLSFPPDNGVWFAIGITAVFATVFAFFVQTWAQTLLPPYYTAIVLTMEPVFAGIFGIAVGGEPFTPRILAGGLFVLGAMLLVQLTRKRKKNGKNQAIIEL